jgi:hypothetical protein
MTTTDTNKLLVVWTSGDPDVAMRMVFMYTANAKRNGWWQDVTLLVWGPSQELLTENSVLQGKLAEMLDLGVRVVACKACADSYPVTDRLEELGVEVFYTGEFLTDWVKSDRAVITF